jgi:hypothetical protein
MPVNTRKSSDFLILDKAERYEEAATTADGPTSRLSAAVVPGQPRDPEGEQAASARSAEWEWAANRLRMHQFPSLMPGLRPPRHQPYAKPRLRRCPGAMSVAGAGLAPTVPVMIPARAVSDRFQAAAGEARPVAAAV